MSAFRRPSCNYRVLVCDGYDKNCSKMHDSGKCPRPCFIAIYGTVNKMREAVFTACLTWFVLCVMFVSSYSLNDFFKSSKSKTISRYAFVLGLTAVVGLMGLTMLDIAPTLNEVVTMMAMYNNNPRLKSNLALTAALAIAIPYVAAVGMSALGDGSFFYAVLFGFHFAVGLLYFWTRFFVALNPALQRYCDGDTENLTKNFSPNRSLLVGIALGVSLSLTGAIYLYVVKKQPLWPLPVP